MSCSFNQSLQFGEKGENQIARFLASKGYYILPAYEVELHHGKGPRIFSAQCQLIAPDMLVFKSSRVLWIEAKTKSAFTWHRLSNTWQTGIDRRHWRDYIRVSEQTPWDVWLLFLHLPNGIAKDTPEGLSSPSGLFGNNVRHLITSVHHEHANHGPSGMVYWTKDALRLLAPSTDFQCPQTMNGEGRDPLPQHGPRCVPALTSWLPTDKLRPSTLDVPPLSVLQANAKTPDSPIAPLKAQSHL